MGISVPKEGYENKTIYIWAENVLGYLSASRVAVGENMFIVITTSCSEHTEIFCSLDRKKFAVMCLSVLFVDVNAIL